jgi:hypothetical protein
VTSFSRLEVASISLMTASSRDVRWLFNISDLNVQLRKTASSNQCLTVWLHVAMIVPYIIKRHPAPVLGNHAR